MTIRRGYVDTPMGQVHFRQAGDRGPPMFFFHQTPLSSRQYERALPHLGRFCRAFAMDTPGYGLSDGPSSPPMVTDYAAQLIAAIDALGIGKFAVGGFATGSCVALAIAGQAGPRITHGVFSGMPVLTEERMKHYADRLGVPKVERDGSHLKQVWDSRVDNYGGDEELDQIQMAVAQTVLIYERMHWGLLAVGKFDLRPILQSLEIPTLFLMAEHDKLVPENRIAASLVKGSRTVSIPGGRPQVCWTMPERYASLVKEFLDA
ncbi:MAG: alpha/beta hydrolase [Alphaproteobacteria bacterium]|nr:alpha/beta hydrolase [Alphaproteobacteria bacterium]